MFWGGFFKHKCWNLFVFDVQSAKISIRLEKASSNIPLLWYLFALCWVWIDLLSVGWTVNNVSVKRKWLLGTKGRTRVADWPGPVNLILQFAAAYGPLVFFISARNSKWQREQCSRRDAGTWNTHPDLASRWKPDVCVYVCLCLCVSDYSCGLGAASVSGHQRKLRVLGNWIESRRIQTPLCFSAGCVRRHRAPGIFGGFLFLDHCLIIL